MFDKFTLHVILNDCNLIVDQDAKSTCRSLLTFDAIC